MEPPPARPRPPDPKPAGGWSGKLIVIAYPLSNNENPVAARSFRRGGGVRREGAGAHAEAVQEVACAEEGSYFSMLEGRRIGSRCQALF
jgi:hypothetical protein